MYSIGKEFFSFFFLGYGGLIEKKNRACDGDIYISWVTCLHGNWGNSLIRQIWGFRRGFDLDTLDVDVLEVIS